MDCTMIHNRLEALCGRCGAALLIQTISDPSAPRQELQNHEGTFVLVLNPARIPQDRYETFACYYVIEFLLPRLVLKTPRLILRRFRMEDSADSFAFLSDAEGAYLDCCKPFSAMDETYFDRMKLFAQREGQYVMALKESGKVIGTVNVFEDNSRAVDAREIGYSVSPEFRRQGYAFEALSNLLHLLQDELMLDMVTAGVLPENAASVQLLKKLGFREEGIRHKAAWHEGLDCPVDLHYYYRDREDAHV